MLKHSTKFNENQPEFLQKMKDAKILFLKEYFYRIISAEMYLVRTQRDKMHSASVHSSHQR